MSERDSGGGGFAVGAVVIVVLYLAVWLIGKFMPKGWSDMEEGR